MEVPFAPHTPAWVSIDDTHCYCVLDGRKIDDQITDELMEAIIKSANEFLKCDEGIDADPYNGFWAGDFICGSVFIGYFRKV